VRRFALLCLLITACDAEEPSTEILKPAPTPVAAAVPVQNAAPPSAPPSAVGTRVDAFADVDWLQGETDKDGTHLVVLWELWCPHCRRELPKLSETAATWADRGLQVSALTRLTRNTPAEKALAFARDSGLELPVGVTTEAVARALKVRGVPAAAVIRDGEVLWTGHPAALDDATLGRLIGG
jgi:thiol-disulfide isomerase/thioredoxin